MPERPALPCAESRHQELVPANAQDWHCDACDSDGTVVHAPHAGVYEVRNLIEDDHARINDYCADVYGLGYVRVIAP